MTIADSFADHPSRRSHDQLECCTFPAKLGRLLDITNVGFAAFILEISTSTLGRATKSLMTLVSLKLSLRATAVL